MIRIIKVTGSSLSPLFLTGDYALILKYYRQSKRYSLGDFIVFQHPQFELLIKQIESVDHDTDTYEVSGTHPLSLDSVSIGSIQHQDILGKVIFHIKNPRRN